MLTSTRFGTLLAAALVLASWHANAAPLLNGVAVHSELGKEQFIAGLYSDSLSTEAAPLLSADVNKRIQVRVLADSLSSRRFKRMWMEGIAINSSQQDLQTNAQYMADFSNMLRAKLIAGDILTIDRAMNGGLTISLNGTMLGEIENRRFFDLLLRTWIGPVPLSSTFRDQLLSNGEIPSDLLARFESTRPDDERIAAIERAISNSNQERADTVQAQPDAVAVSDEPQRKDLIAAPKLDKIDTPALAMVPPTLGASAPGASASTEPEPKPTPKPEPAKQPTKIAKATPAADDDILEDDDDESFTAASLLSRQIYIGQLKSWAQKELAYPTRALRRGWEGNVRLDITVNRNGKLVSVEVAEEAAHSVLTKEALSAVNKAAPFPAMPDDVRGDNFLFTLPVAFKLQ